MRVFFLLCMLLPVYIFPSFEGDFYKTLSDFVRNPKMFFLDLETDSENNLALSKTDISTNLLLQILGVLNLSYNTRYKLNSLDINFGSGLWYFWSIKLIKNIDGLENAKDINMFGFSPFITLSKDLDNIRFFVGTKLSIGYVSFNFRDVIEEQVSDKTLRDMIKGSSYVKDLYFDPALFIGMIIEKDDSYKSIQIGYNILNSRIFAKLVFGGPTFSFFIGFYPDSPIVIHPGLNISF